MTDIGIRPVYDWIIGGGRSDPVSNLIFAVWFEAMYCQYGVEAHRPTNPVWGSEESRIGFIDGWFDAMVGAVFHGREWKAVEHG